MTYIIFDWKGYETWLAESDDLLTWKPNGKIMAFTENTWDANQKAGYISLVNTEWVGISFLQCGWGKWKGYCIGYL
jgi:hypothetical protein